MKKNRLSTYSSLFVAGMISLAPLFPTAASANSAQTWFEGTNAAGVVMMTGTESPVVVERELLTLDIPDLPPDPTYYYEEDRRASFDASVSAEYSFFNPSDYTITVRLLFPFGRLPSYPYDFSDGEEVWSDIEKYTVTADGAPVETTVRHSLSTPYEPFLLSKDVATLHDGFYSDETLSPETLVTRYDFHASGVDTSAYRAATVAFDTDSSFGRIYFPRLSCYRGNPDGTGRCGAGISNGRDTVSIYTIGGTLPSTFAWKIYRDGGIEDGEEIGGSMVLKQRESTTLKEFALSRKTDDSVSDADWYNAVVAEILEEEESKLFQVYMLSRFTGGLEKYLMRWYDYEITLQPNGRLVNRVTAPLYPSIDRAWSPAKYEYVYLLSPAKTWKEFGELQIEIRTPFVMTSCELQGLKKTESGYSLTTNGLPDNELVFTLCTVENPTFVLNHSFYSYRRWSVVAVLVGVLVVAGTVVAVVLIRRKKSANGKRGIKP
ncbi:MAG: hypothetical protein SOT34_05895 [Candidatus Borkfalkiaceae bacterium]|nr:hypothetical protein [Christensenellaceae bacterium]